MKHLKRLWAWIGKLTGTGATQAPETDAEGVPAVVAPSKTATLTEESEGSEESED